MATSAHCNPKRLQDAVAGILDARSQQEVESHLGECDQCREVLNQINCSVEDWGKISDYFGPDSMSTNPYKNAPTVEIQLNRVQGSPSAYLIEESPQVVHPKLDPVLEPASHPEMLGRIGGFEIEELIGRGGMGVVYKGFDTELNRPIAIKVLASHLASNGVARQRFAREARAAAAVMHANVVPIHSVNATATQPYLVMTLVSGRSLQAHIAQHGPLPVKDVVRIAKQIAAGLAAAHRVGLVHRDIKPANILLEKDVSRVMITDFGLARAANDAAITQTGWLAGTPHYMSPEQATGKEVDFRSDLFSLGSVMYCMATGREPFRAEIPVAVLQKINTETPLAVRSVNSDTTQTLSNIIDQLMQKQPGDRFDSASAVEAVLAKYLAHLEQPRVEPKPRIKNARRSKLVRRVVFALVPLLLLIAAVWNFRDVLLPSGAEMGTEMGTETGTGAKVVGETVEPTWPKGLQSPASWQAELNQLKKEIQDLEQSDWRGRPVPEFDPVPAEQGSIEMEIQRLERSLGGE